MDFSPDRMRGHRHGQRLTLKALADTTGIPVDQVKAIEDGDRVPTGPEHRVLAEALEVDMGELRPWRLSPTADYCHAALTYARKLTPEDIETVASVIRQIRGAA